MSPRRLSEEDLNKLFYDSYTTVFCSHNKDGSIHTAPIWYHYHEGAFYFVSYKKARREANIKRNTKVTLSFLNEIPKPGETMGMSSTYANVYGEVDPDYVPEMSLLDYCKWVFKKRAPSGEEYDMQDDHNLFRPLKVVPTKIIQFQY